MPILPCCNNNLIYSEQMTAIMIIAAEVIPTVPHTTTLDSEAAHAAKNAGLVKESNKAFG